MRKPVMENRKRERFQRRLELLRKIRNSNKNRTLLSNEKSSNNPETVELPLEDIIPDPNQPRKNFDEAKLRELAESIRQHGLLQPILVRPLKGGKFELVHGERRWRACKIAGKTTIQAEVRNVGDREKIEIQLVENLQRRDLNPIEEAETFQRLIDEFGYTHEELGNRIGKSRGYVTNKLRLLKLSPEVQEEVRKGNISEGHARATLSLKPNEQKKITREIIDKGLKVRETEQLVRNFREGNNVSRETFGTSTKVKTLLIPISSKIFATVEETARKMKLKPEDLIERAVVIFLQNEGYMDFGLRRLFYNEPKEDAK